MTIRAVLLPIGALVALAALPGCLDRFRRAGRAAEAATSQPASAASTAADSNAPPPPPSAPKPPISKTGNVYADRFLELWTDIHQLSNGYFSPEGIPYHSAETLIVEAPDHGHETTSEAFSYWMWLEAAYGKITKDWTELARAWDVAEYYIIPSRLDQPTNHGYQATRPATFAAEGDEPTAYPMPLDGSVQVGTDPLGSELERTYGSPDVYGMHWLLDVDNFYGFGRRGDGTSRAAYINTFQRGPQESVYETVPQPCWEEFKWGGPNGFLDIFQKAGSFARQWKYTNAPDADARAIQAMYWAKIWADEQGGSSVVDGLLDRSKKMGDYLRYSLFDKYFKLPGCVSPSCPAGKGFESAHYLVSWYYAWGGAHPQGGAWAWRIGSSHNHQGYQNPMAAFALGHFAPLKPKSPNGARDWQRSLERQLEFYRWLQSAEGGIAGGATNSWKGRYEKPPAGTKTFYGMAYDPAPVFLDPPSNDWFGFQAWSMERVAELYYATGNERAKVILDRWVPWVLKHVKLGKDGSFAIPSTLKWSGQPASDWASGTQGFDPKDVKYNATLRVEVLEAYPDIGIAAAVSQTLAFYAKKSGDKEAQRVARELLDRMWQKFRAEGGVVAPESRKDYKRVLNRVYLPPGWTGKMPNGDVIDDRATFLSLRSKLKQDPDWHKVQKYLDGGPPPEFKYHRFWVQAQVAMSLASYAILFNDDAPAPAAASAGKGGKREKK